MSLFTSKKSKMWSMILKMKKNMKTNKRKRAILFNPNALFNDFFTLPVTLANVVSACLRATLACSRSGVETATDVC